MNTEESLQQNAPINNKNKLLAEWKAPEFITHEKSMIWILLAGVILLSIIAYAIYTKSATMAIVFILLAGVYYLTHNQSPKIINIKLSELGIFIDKEFYPYNMINSFWIVYHPPFVHTLNLKLVNKAFRKVVLQLDNQNPVEVRKILAKEIPEIEGEGEGFFDMLTRLLRL